MRSLAIVKAFDVIEDFPACLLARDKGTAIDQVEFKAAPEAFHGGIIVAVALAAHGGDETGLSQGVAIVSAGVLDAAIGMAE